MIRKNSMPIWIKVIFGMIIVAVLSSCETPEEFATPYAKIEGTWEVNSTQLAGSTIPGDGSTFTFSDCEEPYCDGSSYMNSDKTTGNFTYMFIESNQKIDISDASSDGGNFDATWIILDFTNSHLRITAETIFGNMVLDLSKK